MKHQSTLLLGNQLILGKHPPGLQMIYSHLRLLPPYQTQPHSEFNHNGLGQLGGPQGEWGSRSHCCWDRPSPDTHLQHLRLAHRHGPALTARPRLLPPPTCGDTDWKPPTVSRPCQAVRVGAQAGPGPALVNGPVALGTLLTTELTSVRGGQTGLHPCRRARRWTCTP